MPVAASLQVASLTKGNTDVENDASVKLSTYPHSNAAVSIWTRQSGFSLPGSFSPRMGWALAKPITGRTVSPLGFDLARDAAGQYADAALEAAGVEIKRNKSDGSIGLNSGKNAGSGHALPDPVQTKYLGEDREEVSFGCGVYICVFGRRDRANLEPEHSAERSSIRKRQRWQRHIAPAKLGGVRA
jgi:hypothetical protein